jgi:hypothetical protein
MKIDRRPEANKLPTGFIVTCLVLAALALVYALVSARSGNPGDRIGLAGIPVALALLYFAYSAYRRAKLAPGLVLTVELEVPASLPVVPMRVGPLYTLFETPQAITDLGAWWSGNASGYREVVGFTSLGSVFLRNPDTEVYVVLWPLRDGNNASTLERCVSLGEFELRFLKDREHSPVILDPIKVAALRRQYGPLAAGEVYIPVPYPFLAAGKPATVYEKGEFWAFINLCGQMRAQFS